MKDKSGRKRNGTGMLLLDKDRAYGVRSETEMRELFLATLGYVFFLSFSYFYSTLSFFSFPRLCPITDDSCRFFRSLAERRKSRKNEEKRGQAEKCIMTEERRKSEDGGEK